MITEEMYQKILIPFKRANIYYPSTLEEFIRFTKRDLDEDVNVNAFEQAGEIAATLLRINEISFPDEVFVIKKQYESRLYMECG